MKTNEISRFISSFILSVILSLPGLAQKVSNIQYQFSGNQMLITYDLAGEPGSVWRTDVYLSEDEGTTWGSPLREVKGDVGDSIIPGNGKKIIWERYAEGKDILKKISFLVVATADKFYSSPSGLFRDARTGIDYKWVRIGKQIWMAENLNFGYMAIGNEQPANNEQVEKYCYNNLEANCEEYGGLYHWDEMMQFSSGPGTKGICPENWHIPSEAEWDELIFFLGGKTSAYGRMKEVGNVHWEIRTKGATNDSDFSALPGGLFTPETEGTGFRDLRHHAYFWTSTERDPNTAYAIGIGNLFLEVYYFSASKQNGYSVRCLRD